MNTFALLTAEAWRKDDVEAMENAGEIWINQTHLQEKLHVANIADKTQYYSSEFKKMRCEIRECGNYQPCRIFIENTLAVQLAMSSVKTMAAIFKTKFGINQHDKVLRKQSLGLRLKKIFPNEDIKEEYAALHYRNDFIFKNRILVVESDELGHIDRDSDYEKKRQKELKNCGYYIIRIDSNKKDFNDHEEFDRASAYITKSTKESTKKSLIDDLSKRLLETKFENSNSIKAKWLKWIVKKILPTI